MTNGWHPKPETEHTPRESIDAPTKTKPTATPPPPSPRQPVRRPEAAERPEE